MDTDLILREDTLRASPSPLLSPGCNLNPPEKGKEGERELKTVSDCGGD